MAEVSDRVKQLKIKLISSINGLTQLSKREKIGKLNTLPGDSKFFNLTQTVMKERINSLPKYGIFAGLDFKMQPMLDSSRQPGDSWTKLLNMKQSNLKKQLSFRMQPLMPRDVWSQIRRESQLPDSEQIFDRFALDELNPQSIEAVKQARSKISTSLNLPIGNLARLARLRKNVMLIENKFKSHIRTRQRESAKGKGGQGVFIEEEETRGYRPPRFVEAGQALKFFRRYARIVIIVLQWISLIKETNSQHNWDQQLKSFIDMTVEIEQGAPTKALDAAGLEFDKNNFKANKEISLSTDVRQILSIRPELRTTEMLKQVLHGLQTLQSLSEYPLGTQQKLCKVAWYQRVEAKKAIIRQGHYPECFYFTLSGTGYVKKLTEDPLTGDVRNVVLSKLTRGESFGELGLVFNMVRTATVESATPMELLVIRKEDFLTIFMNAENPEEEADHIRFLRQLPVMKSFPVEVLTKEPELCLLNYFKRGSVIVENNRNSDWLYIIKSGSCEAIQRLQAVRPRAHKRRFNVKRHERLCLGITESSSRSHSASSYKTNKENVNTKVVNVMSYNLKNGSNSKTKPFVLPKISIDPVATISKYDVNETLKTATMPFSQSSSDISSTSYGSGNWSNQHLQNLSMEAESLLYQKERAMNTRQNTCNEVFVKVELLQSSDIFGLQTIQWDDEEPSLDTDVPQVSLVSRGAEIILLSKKIFQKYANDQVKMTVKSLTRPYPKAKTMQENLQIQVDWDLYRGTVLSEYIAFSNEKRSLKVKV